MYNLQKFSTSVLWHKLSMTGKGYFYPPTRRTVFFSRFVFFKDGCPKPIGHFQLPWAPSWQFTLPLTTQTPALFTHTHTPDPPPVDQRPGSLGDSRDKDGVDEVGGAEAGGGCLPVPEQGVEVAAVQNWLRMHGGHRTVSWLEWRSPRGSAVSSALGATGGTWGMVLGTQRWSHSPRL